MGSTVGMLHATSRLPLTAQICSVQRISAFGVLEAAAVRQYTSSTHLENTQLRCDIKTQVPHFMPYDILLCSVYLSNIKRIVTHLRADEQLSKHKEHPQH
jgi:hypothetical protein